MLTDDFADSRVSLEDPGADRAAAELAAYAEEREIPMQTGEISEAGTILFRELEPGLYLLMQKDAADGYIEVNPFLVSIPMLEDGEYIYAIDASPKVETKKSEIPSEPEKPGRPQTGDSGGVLPYAAAAGGSLCAVGVVGYAVFVHGRKKKYER